MKRLTKGLLVLLLLPATAYAEKIVVEWAPDATKNIQAALDRALVSTGSITVVIPNVGKIWWTDPLFIHSNTTLELRPGVILHARRKSFYGKSDALITIRDAKRVTILGFGATIRGWGREWTDTCRWEHSEWRFGINVKSSRNVWIRDLTIENFGGSGIAVIPIPGSSEPCQGVGIVNVTCDENYREGLFVASVVGLYVYNCEFKNTAGHNTQAGINLEPNTAEDRMSRIRIVNCRATGNNGPGFTAWLHKLNPESERVDIRYVNCISRNNRKPTPIVSAVNGLPAGSVVEFVDCSFFDPEWADTYPGATFRNCQRILLTATVEQVTR